MRRRFLFLSVIVLLLWKPADAKVYRCEGANGTPILTDQPKGKRSCVVISTATPSLPSGFTPPTDRTPPAQPDLLPDVTPPSASPLLPRHLLPTEQAAPPVASQEPLAPAAPEAQHCSPRVNPFNPFAGMNCSPTTGNSGDGKTP
jgi:hypothetical protein